MLDRPKSPSPPVVLVVDDEPTVLHLMARALVEAGYTVHTASNGQDALALAATLAKPLDLVVTDIRMEPIEGPELAESMFAQGLASRFLFVSGYGPAAGYMSNSVLFCPSLFRHSAWWRQLLLPLATSSPEGHVGAAPLTVENGP